MVDIFRAMADQLEGDPSLHFTYRSNICDYISESREDFEPFVEDDEPFDAVRSVVIFYSIF
jgi:hypothetical protein